jgi:hypothetical protein
MKQRDTEKRAESAQQASSACPDN